MKYTTENSSCVYATGRLLRPAHAGIATFQTDGFIICKE
jgi:hypothetical protein